MAIYQDGPPRLDPLMIPCGGPSLDPSSPGATDAEAELRHLFRQISGGFSQDPSGDLVSEILGSEPLTGSPPISVDRSELFDRWFQKFCGGREDDPYDRRVPDLKRRIKRLIGRLLDEKIACLFEERKRRQCDPLSEMLMLLKGVATDPGGERAWEAVREWKEPILKARQALFKRLADIPSTEEFPYRKRLRTNQLLPGTSSTSAILFLEKLHAEQNGRPGSQEMLNQPSRRPRRTFGLLKLCEGTLPRKRIPVGDFFQAVVPEWKGPPIKRDVIDGNEDLDDSRWLGTRIWPIEGDDREKSEKMIGKGRPDLCGCGSPGSMDCIRFHVSTSRLQLKSELGRAFFGWGFDGMGEEVSNLWIHEEQMRFDDLVRLNRTSEDKSFWESALKCFTSKSSRNIASYYFNVFVLRRMSNQTRLASGAADSDDDENNGNAHDDENSGRALQASYTAYSQRCLKRKS